MSNKIIISAGDAITAKLIKEAGFNGIWVSGFEVSARLGLQDNGSLTMDEMLSVARPIVDATDLPVYVDVDTGYGNFQRTVKEFERIGAAGVCVEDNIPQLKQNSLWGEKIPLLSKIEFVEKLKVDRVRIEIIARTEALIRGYGVMEAMDRLETYSEHADILLPHSRDYKLLMNVNNLFAKPCFIVPTKFPEITNEELFRMGYEGVIWANQILRTQIYATRKMFLELKRNDRMLEAESHLCATLEDLKNLTPNE
jgi:phosphoenolpyruvate phosphomutase